MKGETGEGDALTPKEWNDLASTIKKYLNDHDEEAILNIGKLTITKIKSAFRIFKSLISDIRCGEGVNMRNDLLSNLKSDSCGEVAALKSCLLQRDNEIAILVNMVKKGKTIDDISLAQMRNVGSNGEVMKEFAPNAISLKSNEVNRLNSGESGEDGEFEVSTSRQESREMQHEQGMKFEEQIVKKHLFGIPPPDDKTLFEDPAVCFEWFRERSSLQTGIKENKELLKRKYEEARLFGDRANKSRSTIQYLKKSIESIRRDRALRELVERENPGSNSEICAEEETYRRAIDQEKDVYKENFESLRVLKSEIEHLRKILEKTRVTLLAQFDRWFNALHHRDGEVLSSSSIAHTSGHSRTPLAESKTKGMNEFRHVRTGKDSKENSNDGDFLKDTEGGAPDCSDDVNQDILAFYHAKGELLKRRNNMT